MPKALSESDVDRYRERGFLFPLDALEPSEAQALRARYESQSHLIAGRSNQKPHLLFPWLSDLIRHPRVLDAVEDLLGPDLLCWSSQFFSKPAGDAAYVSWHQDATYWGLSSPDVVTAWIALTPSTPQSGCMRVIPGTHRRQVPHEDRFDDKNLLSRGQEISVQVDQDQAVDVVLAPGQFSLHHVLLFHSSEPNRSALPRVGFAVRYIPTFVHQTAGERESATLVRGVDRYGHFDRELPPESDLHPDAVARHRAIIDRQLRILYAGAQQRGKLGPEGTGARASN
ncbi:MAG TPA: phytanoyl-CoA dioxygenase family protein [Burkholderiaceae bacterium]|jgi:non-haem Fe2+, alpha-ketoglutarate-dependent halogenase|nr:phytanoyl-CoA dioxygenase family protein [Burkholderiaceae bacterium]